MLLWLKKNLAMKHDGLPMLCDTCPCMEFIFPRISEVFPFWVGLGDYTIGWTNAGWDALDLTEYDPDTDLWIDPPYFECMGDNDTRVVYFFGFTPLLWTSSTGRDPYATGASRICIPGISECPPPPYYFNVFQKFTHNPLNGHEVRFDFFDLPDKLAFSSSNTVLVKPGHIYTFKAYDIDEYPEVLMFEGKIVVHFQTFDIHIHDIENPAVDFHAYAIDYGTYPFEYKAKTVPYSVYDMDDNLLYSSFSWNEIAAVYGQGCFPDIDYSLLGKCTFSGQDCTGCLKDVDFKITSDSMAEKLDGDCRNIASIERKGSYSYTLLMAGFESRHDADDYLDANRAGLTAQMKSQCAGASWYIVGTCECSDENCEQCVAVDGSISIKCEDDIEPCYEEGGTYYKTARLAYGQGFSDFMEASQYLTEHSDELEGELDEECPGCEDGKYYGVHIWPDWHDGVNGGSCYYGFPYTEVFDCGMITYYRDNPEEFYWMYGEGASFEIVTDPFDDWFEVWDSIKKYRVNHDRWGNWECPGTPDSTDYFCLSFFKYPGYKGGGICLGGGVWCRYGSQTCMAYGSRKITTITEDPSCRRC